MTTLGNEQCFALWAPANSPWSLWAKPVLFSQMALQPLKPRLLNARPDLRLPDFDRSTALVLDLGGEDAVTTGLEAARRGWRPVPLFNATSGPKAVVDVIPVMESLAAAAEELQGIPGRDDAPPAFLLDARRMIGSPGPGDYDNRWVALPQDFPSATFLQSRGIRQAVLVQLRSAVPQTDLGHVMLRWQQGGIALRFVSDDQEGTMTVRPPNGFRKAWYRVVALLGLKRNNVGGFGGQIPEISSGGYG